MVKRDTRKYKCFDAAFIEFASLHIELLEEYHSEFEFFSSIFNTHSLQKLEDLLHTAINIPQDRIYRNRIAEATENFNLEMANACKFYQHCLFEIKNTFPGNKEMWKFFGASDYSKAKTSFAQMRQFLEVFRSCLKDRIEELSFGEEEIKLTGEHIHNLATLQSKQKVRKEERFAATCKRVEVLNMLYDGLADYFKAAKLIFTDNPAVLKLFNFNPVNPKRKTKKDEKEMITEKSDHL
ncbi:hypothetical protein [Ancylomarina longa]|uniref:Uncharacterized protein n=1 Tax=Ancylomarina longa TaxID=2487017 RepID=A0A434AF33_9BACT|nr:hypothetical protein [Ancylomarina longa]RUT72980.1 hypothetical protein DLK05_15755 [Ancylomarina longa]